MNPRNVSRSLLVAVLFGSAALANATVVNWGNHAQLEIGADLVAPGAFDDYYNFNLTGTDLLSSVAVANNLAPLTWITGGTVSLFSGTHGSALPDTFIGSYTFNGGTGSVAHSLNNLVPGDYFYSVSGTATGSLGGFYDLSSSISPVPEPETYGLVLMGMGALVAGMRWRAKR